MSVKRIVSLLLVICMAASAVSCIRKQEKESDFDEVTPVIDLENIRKAVIVRPDNAKDYEIDAAARLKEIVKEKYGVELAFKTDWIKKGEAEPEDFEILVGKTSRALSVRAYERFTDSFQYSLACDGKKIAIGGDNLLSLQYALEVFELNFLGENGIVMGNDTLIVNSMSNVEIDYIRKQTNAGKFYGLQDDLDDSDKNHGEYKLVFSEEFNKGKIDTSVWTHEFGYIANNELQYYNDRDKNSRIESECLVIEAHKESMNGYAYTSARLNTKGKFSFKYGYIEMRAILPEGQGIWPAFWMMGNKGSWPACGEIDIMEMIGGSNREDTVHGTVHWGTSSPYNHMSYGLSTTSKEDLSEGFHTYGVEWTESYIKWYLDGKQFCVIDITGEQFSMFKQEFYILVNLAVGGDWPGSPNSSTVFPQQYVIDYIRVYQ